MVLLGFLKKGKQIKYVTIIIYYQETNHPTSIRPDLFMFFMLTSTMRLNINKEMNLSEHTVLDSLQLQE